MKTHEHQLDIHDHYAQLLGIANPWEVADVHLNTKEQKLTIRVHVPEGAHIPCPTCGAAVPLYDHRKERSWRHLDTMQFITEIIASLPRANCPDDGIHTIHAPWAESNSGFTIFFERFAIDVLRATTSITAAESLLRINWHQVQRIKKRAVARGLERRKDEAISYVGIDEKSFLKGHHYASIASDIQQGRILDIVEHRTQESAENLLEKAIPEHRRDDVQAVSADMWVAFSNAARAVFRNDIPIVHDKFHVAKYLNTAVDQVRRSEHKKLLKQGDESLKKTKYLFLRTPDAWEQKEKEKFDMLLTLELQVGTAWSHKEMFRHFWEYVREYAAEQFFDKWHTLVMDSGITPMIKVAKMLKKHIEGLLSYCTHKITNAVAEGLNNVVQNIKANARGFRNFEHYRIAILFTCGKLEMYP